MASKEFDLLISLIITMLEKGETQEVIKLLKENQKEKNSD